MEKIKIQSEEKNFFEYIKKMGTINGVIGVGNRLDRSLNPPKMIDGCQRFLIFNENLKVIFNNEPFDKSGNYHKNVVNKLKELGINDDDDTDNLNDDDENLNFERTRTDDSVEEVITNLQTSASLNWSIKFYSDEVDEDLFPKRLPKENFDVEESSDEFKEFKKVCSFMNNEIILHSTSRLDLKEIEYETFTEKGKKVINESIEWFKNNKSKTPIQDAWLKVLEKNGVKVDYKPFDLWNDSLPVMKKVDYSSKEEIDAKRKLEDEAFKKSITPEQREQFKRIAEQLKQK